jgi:hypothetical protein
MKADEDDDTFWSALRIVPLFQSMPAALVYVYKQH